MYLYDHHRDLHKEYRRQRQMCIRDSTSTIEDVTYTANMAYADFYPELLNEHQCIKYAAAVANDKDGYTGIQFCRWVADVVGKKENIDWDKFK